MRAGLFALLVLCLVGAGCRTQSNDSAQADAYATPAPASEKQRADRALLALLASRSIQEVPLHRDASVDLDNDGVADLLMLLDDQNWCDGDGCTLLVFQGHKDGGYRLVSECSATRMPIALGSRLNHGWHDLLVTVGSGDETGMVALEFDGQHYPPDPTMAALLDPSRLPSSRTLISAEPKTQVATQ